MTSAANVYIDGFNLYNGLKRRAKSAGSRFEHRWLDLRKLAEWLMPDIEIGVIYYCTSPVKRFVDDPSQAHRQEAFWRALQTIKGVEIVKGKFEKDPAPRRLVDTDEEVQVWNIKEKGSDVNLAALLLRDAYEGRCRRAAVVSDDSDLALPIKIADSLLQEGVSIFSPNVAKESGKKLGQNATFYRRIPDKAFDVCGLPSTLTSKSGRPITKPPEW